MRAPFKYLSGAFLLFVFALLPLNLSSAHADAGVLDEDVTPAPTEASIVTDIQVRGNKTVATSTIMSQIRTEIGRPAVAGVLSEDLKRLYGLGFFKDVKIDQDTSSGRLVVIFTVSEKPTLQK